MLTALDHVRVAAEDPSRLEALLGRRAELGRIQLSNTALEAAAGPPRVEALVFAGAAEPGDTHGVDIRTTLGRAHPPAAFAADEASAVAALDHVVVRTPDPDRAIDLYARRLGLELKLDRTNPDWGMRLLFFRCGGAIIEVTHPLGGPTEGDDEIWGLAWRVPGIEAAHARMASAFDLTAVRAGRKPGTRVFTVRDAGLPTLILAKEA